MKLSEATKGLRVTVVDSLLNPLNEDGTVTGTREGKVLIETDDGDLIFCSAREVKSLEGS